MAKYENNYIESLNRQLAEAQTRLEILTEYVTGKDAYVDARIVQLILGIPEPVEKTAEEEDADFGL